MTPQQLYETCAALLPERVHPLAQQLIDAWSIGDGVTDLQTMLYVLNMVDSANIPFVDCVGRLVG